MTILADSCCDLSPELLKKTQAKIAPLTITIDDTHYVDDGTVDIPPYLAAMKASKNPVRSACPSPDLYAEDIRATEGDCFIVTLSAKLSGSHNAASLGSSRRRICRKRRCTSLTARAPAPAKPISR